MPFRVQIKDVQILLDKEADFMNMPSKSWFDKYHPLDEVKRTICCTRNKTNIAILKCLTHTFPAIPNFSNKF